MIAAQETTILKAQKKGNKCHWKCQDMTRFWQVSVTTTYLPSLISRFIVGVCFHDKLIDATQGQLSLIGASNGLYNQLGIAVWGLVLSIAFSHTRHWREGLDGVTDLKSKMSIEHKSELETKFKYFKKCSLPPDLPSIFFLLCSLAILSAAAASVAMWSARDLWWPRGEVGHEFTALKLELVRAWTADMQSSKKIE